jgi:hypothetical protein
MVALTSTIFERSGDVCIFKVGVVSQNVRPCSAPGQHIKNVGYAYPEPADARTATIDIRVRRDAAELAHSLYTPKLIQRNATLRLHFPTIRM